MKTKIDSTYRVVIPTHIRKALEITQDTELQINQSEGLITIQVVKEGCTFCNTSKSFMRMHKGKWICRMCCEDLGIGG